MLAARQKLTPAERNAAASRSPSCASTPTLRPYAFGPLTPGRAQGQYTIVRCRRPTIRCWCGSTGCERDYAFVDTLNEYYTNVRSPDESAVHGWRKYSYEEIGEQVRREARPKRSAPSAVIGGIIAGANSNRHQRRPRPRDRGGDRGVYAFRAGYDQKSEIKTHTNR